MGKVTEGSGSPADSKAIVLAWSLVRKTRCGHDSDVLSKPTFAASAMRWWGVVCVASSADLGKWVDLRTGSQEVQVVNSSSWEIRRRRIFLENRCSRRGTEGLCLIRCLSPSAYHCVRIDMFMCLKLMCSL